MSDSVTDMKVKKLLMSAAVSGALALTALAPAAFALADGGVCGNGGMDSSCGYGYPSPYTTNNFYGGGGGGYWGGYGYGYPQSLGDFFVLDRLFSGPNGNGILSPYGGTSLGDVFILDQLFSPGYGGGYPFF